MDAWLRLPGMQELGVHSAGLLNPFQTEKEPRSGSFSFSQFTELGELKLRNSSGRSPQPSRTTDFCAVEDCQRGADLGK